MNFIGHIFMALLLSVTPLSEALACCVVDEGVLTSYTCQEKEIVIPSNVTEIGVDALRDKGLTKVEFPPELKIIRSYALAYNNLSHVELPQVEEIYQSAFLGNDIQKLILPISALSKLETSAFNDPIFRELCPPDLTQDNVELHKGYHKACPKFKISQMSPQRDDQ